MNYRHVLKFADEIRMAKQINTYHYDSTIDNKEQYAVSNESLQSIYKYMFQPSVEKAVVVDIENILPLAKHRLDEGAAIGPEEFPEFRLPYPEIWFEYRGIKGLVGMDNVIFGSRVGILARCIEQSQADQMVKQRMGEEDYLHFDFTLFMKMKHTILGPTICLAIRASRAGEIVFADTFNYGDKRCYEKTDDAPINGKQIVRMKPFSDSRSRFKMSALATLIYPALVAVQMMNCKNIEQVEKEPPQTINERHRRDHPPLVKYKVLKIDRKKSSSVGATGDVQNPGIMPFHFCRGHFKRFTAEKPLLGKHVGTYWWEHQARGSRKKGEVIKDYEVS